MRTGGILMPIFSLPSPYGIGTLGREAKQFVDFLVKGGQTYWQILPVCPTSYGDSPYQSFSSFAGNPYFIDLDELCHKNLLTKEECESYDWGSQEASVDYEKIYHSKYALLRKCFQRFEKDTPGDFFHFCKKQKSWLEDYALFMALKDANNGKAWSEWEEELRTRNPKALQNAEKKYAADIHFYKMIQYLFFKQWEKLKNYANKRGIRIIGDVPIYVSYDSADVWADTQLFELDKKLEPVEVAGCPPDAFCEDGQLWGNPLYRWGKMKKDGYKWWIRRIKAMSKLYDTIRIDHFRGFESYYAIPAKDKTARNGKWKKGPGISLFRQAEKKLGKLSVIAEDLGFLTPAVVDMLKKSGFPGMKVLQFAFDSREGNDYLPHNYEKNCVVYTGTHDNDTVIGWLRHVPKETVRFAEEYLNLTKKEGYHWGMMRGAWASVAELAIVPIQDVIGLDSDARINTPSTLGTNWKWRALKNQITDKMAERLREYMQMYGRLS